MTDVNKLQTLKIVCPQCGKKQLRTAQWLSEHQLIECQCGTKTHACDLEQLVVQAVNDLK